MMKGKRLVNTVVELPAATDAEIELIANTLIPVQDFPKPGILFRDITPILAHPEVFKTTINVMVRRYQAQPIDVICGLESRGFLFACALAHELSLPFVPIRKPNKLPRKTISYVYHKEYGQDEFHIHADAIQANQKVLIVDDLIATGGTAEAAVHLVEKAGAIPFEMICVVELLSLKGRDKLTAPLYSMVALKD